MAKNEKKEKKEKTEEFNILGSFSVRIKSNKPKQHLTKIVTGNAPHVRNMLIILRNKLFECSKQDDFAKEVHEYFKSSRILRDAIYYRKGNSVTKIKKIQEYFEKDSIWISLCKFSQKYLDAKTTYSIIQELNKNYKESAKRLNEYNENKLAYFEHYKTKGTPNFPKTKKLKKVNQASIMLDGEKWSCKTINKHNYIRIKLGYEAVLVPVNFEEFPIPKDCVLRSLNVVHSNGAIYLNFGYGKMEKIKKQIIKPKKKEQKIAAMDLGLKLLFSIFINDFKTDSFAFSNKKFIEYNCKFNRFIAKIDSNIAKEATEWKDIKVSKFEDNGDVILDENNKPIKETIQIAIKYSKRGEDLKKYRQFLFEKRERFFKSEYEKISTHLANTLIKLNITDLVLSKNLSFLKNESDKTKMHKKTQQKFYQIPMGGFLNMLIRKLDGKIKLHLVDESHTSKTSCLSKNVNEMKELRLKRGKSLSTNDYGGSRVKRGLYKDYRTGLFFHADINGAINHIKIKFEKLDFSWLIKYKTKICNPKIFTKSEGIANIICSA